MDFLLTEKDLFKYLKIQAGIVIRSLDEAYSMLQRLDEVIGQGRPKGLSINLWNELVSQREQLKAKLKT